MCLLIPTSFFLLAALGRASGSLQLSPSLAEAERYVNDTYIVTCHGPGARNTTWKGPTGQVISSNKGRVHVEERKSGEDHVVSLVFENIDRDDRGNYTCSSSINGDRVQLSFNLIVVRSISFLGVQTEQNTTEHQNYLVKCEVTGDPPPTVVWLVKGKSLPTNDPRYTKMLRGLYIANVTHEDSGEYQCRAFQVTSQNSNFGSKVIHLKVLHKPVWRMSNKSDKDLAFGYMGGIANVTCEAFAEPLAEFIWKRNSRTVRNSANYTVIHEPHRSVLQVVVSDPSVFGEYECMAENYLGMIHKMINLQKGVKPVKPTHVGVKSVGVKSAQLDLKTHSKEDVIIGYRVQFSEKKDGNFSWTLADYQDIYNSDPVPYTIKDLKESTIYRFRVASRNAAGLSDYSREFSLTTRASFAPKHRPHAMTLIFTILCTLVFL